MNPLRPVALLLRAEPVYFLLTFDGWSKGWLVTLLALVLVFLNAVAEAQCDANVRRWKKVASLARWSIINALVFGIIFAAGVNVVGIASHRIWRSWGVVIIVTVGVYLFLVATRTLVVILDTWLTGGSTALEKQV